MIGSSNINTINAWAECQKLKVPVPLEDDNLFYTVVSLTNNGWHWHDDIPEGFVQVEEYELVEHAIEGGALESLTCPNCGDVVYGAPESEAFNLENDDEHAQFRDLIARQWDEYLYAIVLDAEGIVFLTKEK
jgi:hypothetical protein